MSEEDAKEKALKHERVPSRSILWGLALLALAPEKLVRYAVQIDRQLFASYGQSTHDGYEAQTEKAVHALRGAHGSALGFVASAVVSGLIAGRLGYLLIGAASAAVREIATDVGIGILLWATLSVVGDEIATFKGVTFVEKVDRWSYRLLYFAGTAILAGVAAWPASFD
jgi:hypothetical protein